MAMADTIHTAPTIALLGSTGKTGRVILRLLLAKGLYNLRIYVRSREKIVALFPNIASNPRVQLCVGHIADQNAMQACLSGAEIIICTIGGYSYFPDTSLRESASSVIAALNALRQRGSAWRRPRMLYLSSATRSERFAAARPKFVHWLIETAFRNGYDDLKGAIKVILADPTLVSVLMVQPNVLVQEENTGYEISTEFAKLAVSYEDLGEAFVELALESGYDQLSEVGVSSRQGDRAAKYAPIIVSRLLRGLFARYVPGALTIANLLERASWSFWSRSAR